jgi:hypothetical protein
MPTRMTHMEAGSNTSTIALRVVEDDGKGTRCQGYKWATLSLEDIDVDTWSSRLGCWTHG